MLEFKTYRVYTMKQAYDAAIKELGSDVIMTNSIKVRQKGAAGFFKKRVLEVTFCYDSEKTPSAVRKKYDYNTGTGPSGGTGSFPMMMMSNAGNYPAASNLAENPQAAEFNERLEKRMDVFEATVTKLEEFMKRFDIVKRDITYDYPDDIQVLLERMIEEQVREDLAHTLAKETERLMHNKPGAKATEVLEHLLQEQLGRAEPIVHKKFTQRVILVLGPTGVGKTTTIIKLAADFVKNQRKNVGIINTDNYRIGAQDQLKIYADILGVPLRLVYYPDEINNALEEMGDRDVIFVDTAGKRPGDEEYKKDLLDMIRILKPEDILLCLSATTGFASIKEMIDTYGFIDNYRLLVTKLDETKYRGTVLNMSWYARKPLAYVTTGQDVPDDIEIANIEKIVRDIVNPEVGK